MCHAASALSLTGFVKDSVAPGAIILTDGWGAYAPLSSMGYRHQPRTQGPAERAGRALAAAVRVSARSGGNAWFVARLTRRHLRGGGTWAEMAER